MPILFVSGVNDPSTAAITLDENGNIAYILNGNCSVEPQLPLREGIAARFVIFGKAIRQSSIEFKTPPSLIFNQIADPDTHRGALERCVELCDQVNTTVINHPRHVLRTSREQVVEMLQGIPGLIVPRTQRFRPRSPDEVFSRASSEGFNFPFIVRVVGLHDGRAMVKVDNRDDYRWLHALPYDGREFYLIQYIDCRDEQGLYHKQRFAVIDGKPILRHSIYSDHWNIHGASRAFMLEREGWDAILAREEKLENEVLPRFVPAFEEIAKRLQLEYFGVDCNLGADGQMIVFEANPAMNILYLPHQQHAERVKRIQDKLCMMLTKYSGERVI